MSDPVLLLLDEPPRAVDAVVRQLCLEFHVPILVATRDLDAALALGDLMLVLNEGRVVQSGPPRRVLDQPANAEVARLLGIANLLEAEIKALDPGRNTSRLQLDGFELTGPYFPGRLLGDRVWLCAHAEDLKAAGANGAKPGTNQVAVKLLQVREKPGSMRLEFSHGIRVEIPQQEFVRQKDNKEWLVEFPPNSLRVL
jgi:ABC-type Fe3+/spermidine/putrescine transport system ATPase subunit